MSVKPFYNLPPELEDKVSKLYVQAESEMASRDYQKAIELFQDGYKSTLNNQSETVRFHKGYVLHQIGYALVQLGKFAEATEYFLLAYIEDILSQEQGQEDNAEDLPAAKNLRNFCKVPNEVLNSLRAKAMENKKKGEIILDPRRVLSPEAAKSIAFLNLMKEKIEAPPSPRKPGQFTSDWKNRVFVGACYSTHIAEVNLIKECCNKLRYDPVVASEFETPHGQIHHHALMLLHECSRAIFEVSADAGQLMEIERLRDYQVKTLIVFQRNAHLSGMLVALLDSEGYEVKRYSDMHELEQLVTEFLG